MAKKIQYTKAGAPRKQFKERGTTIYASNDYLIKVGQEHDKSLGEVDAFEHGKAIVAGRLVTNEGDE